MGVVEERAGTTNLVCQSNRAASPTFLALTLRKLLAKPLEVGRAQISDKTATTEYLDKGDAREAAILPMPAGQLSGVDKGFLGFQELIDQRSGRSALPLWPWVRGQREVVFLVKPPIHSPLRIIPRAKGSE